MKEKTTLATGRTTTPNRPLDKPVRVLDERDLAQVNGGYLAGNPTVVQG
jgi:hypothetical protein